MSEHPQTRVPTKAHYSSNYVIGGRIYSYAHQLQTALVQKPTNLLEVGKGPGLVASALRAAGVIVVTLDVQPDLEPDLVGSVTKIPARDNAYDVSLCCQVLEHLSFDQFVPALRELWRVTSRKLVLSLPDLTRHYYIKLRLPKLKELAWEHSFPFWPPEGVPSLRVERDGHLWEVGCRGTTVRDVRVAILKSGWSIERTWRVPEMVWHRFFLLKKMS